MSPTIRSGEKPSSRMASAPPSTPIRTGLRSRTYGRSVRRSFLWSTPRTTTSAGRSRKRVSKSGRSRFPETSSRSSRMCAIVFSANASSASPIPRRPASYARVTASRSWTSPSQTSSSPRYRRPPRTITCSPSLRTSKSGAPGMSTRWMPASVIATGPWLPYRGDADGETFNTQRTPVATRSSPDTRSIAAWSITAMSVAPRRFTSRLVRLPIFAGPANSSSSGRPPFTPSRLASLRGERDGRREVRDTAIAGGAERRYPPDESTGSRGDPAQLGGGQEPLRGGREPLRRGHRSLRRGQELLRVAARTRVRRVGAEHPAQLRDEVGLLERLDGRTRDLALSRLLDPEVPARERRDLRQVGDADDLAPLRERSQALADRAGGLPADAS